jgi:hypothetical protein
MVQKNRAELNKKLDLERTIFLRAALTILVTAPRTISVPPTMTPTSNRAE